MWINLCLGWFSQQLRAIGGGAYDIIGIFPYGNKSCGAGRS